MSYAIVKYKTDGPGDPSILDASTSVLVGMSVNFSDAKDYGELFSASGFSNLILKKIGEFWFSGDPENGWKMKETELALAAGLI